MMSRRSVVLTASVVVMAIAAISGCSSSANQYKQLPIELDILGGETHVFHYPSRKQQIATKELPGSPWYDIARAIAKSAAEAIGYAYWARVEGGKNEDYLGYNHFYTVRIRWGPDYERVMYEKLCKQHKLYLNHMAKDASKNEASVISNDEAEQ